jgi:hypothetical protein
MADEKHQPRKYALEVVKGDEVIPVSESVNWSAIEAMEKVSEAELNRVITNPTQSLKGKNK